MVSVPCSTTKPVSYTHLVFDYDFSSGGGGVHRGKWTRGVERVFEKHAIAVDFSIRGWDDSPAPPLGTARKNPPAAKITWRSEIKYFRCV